MDQDPILETLRTSVGTAFEISRTAADPVSSAQIRRWLEAMGDDSSIYLDPRSAKLAGRDGLTAPPAMLAAFSSRSLKQMRAATADYGALTTMIGELGLSPAGVGIAHSYGDDIRIGDVITETTQVERVSSRKETRLGGGYFISLRTVFINQYGVELGVQHMTVLAYSPTTQDSAEMSRKSGANEPASAPAPDDAARPPREPLPALFIPIDRLGIIACCAANGDFAAGHYDPDIARALGFEDIFTDVYTGIGLVHRFVTGWADAGSRVREINLKLGASFYAGDTLRLEGEVRDRAGSAATLGIRGLCRTGLHLDGMVRLEER